MNDVAKAILQGDHDSDLDALQAAITQRRRMARQANAAVTMASIDEGDTVRFKDIRPKYMIGKTGKVVGKRRTKLLVTLDKPEGRFSGGPITVPASCVELVEKAA